MINFSPLKPSIVKSRAETRRLKFKVLRQLFSILTQKTGNPFKALLLILKIRKKYQSTFGEPLLTKAAKVNNRYYWRIGTPGFPSTATRMMHEHEVNRLISAGSNKGLRSIIFAITKKCPLNCEHCFEWENLNQKERLTTENLVEIVHKFQDYGTTQMMFTGGEPMIRIMDIFKVLTSARPGTDFWIITSGIGFTKERAQQLKLAGLTGVMISIDHHEEQKHNRFRGYEGAFEAAILTAVEAKKIGLVTALSLCATKEYISKENISAYMELAKNLGVTFVQFLDPRSSGRYSGKDVSLSPDQTQLLEQTYLDYNSLKAYKEYPIINYLGYHQRRVGCFGAGDRFFYIDTDGDAHICPYCTQKIGSTIQLSAEEVIGSLAQSHCHVHEKAEI